MRVIISPNDAVPVEFSHPALLVPNAEALAAAPARAEPLAREAVEAAESRRRGEESCRDRSRVRQHCARRRCASWNRRRPAPTPSLRAPRRCWPPQRPTKPRRKPRRRKQKAAAKAAEAGTQLETAKAEAKSKPDPAAVKEAAKVAETKKAAAAKAALEAKLALEPVSIYISRATSKLYVRRNTHKPAPDGGGTVYDSTIEVPVAIRDAGRPIGTHVFTAVAPDGAGLRWTAVTIDGDDAKGALDRITIPKDVLDRIAPTALPRSSIVISDEPLSEETNYRTEFVAVLSNQPQGGFITRERTPMVAANDPYGDDGLWFFQRGWHSQTGPQGSAGRGQPGAQRGGSPQGGSSARLGLPIRQFRLVRRSVSAPRATTLVISAGAPRGAGAAEAELRHVRHTGLGAASASDSPSKTP